MGHLALADEALANLDLAQVRFVPNADPPHKQGQAVTAATHREAMVALAIAERPQFVLDRLELERPGPSYAVDTVATLAEDSRLQGRPEPWFILATEVLEGFPAWRQPERVLDLCRIAVAPRAGARSLDRDWVSRQFPGREDRFAFMAGPVIDVAATHIRKRLLHGKSVSELVPASVVAYIDAHGLYRPGTGE
jgi:nicotinate-nucleotide adenylyltransferase